MISCPKLVAGTGAWILLLAAPVPSRADTLFSNFGPGFSYNTSAGNFVGNAFDGTGNNYAEGDTFTPLETAAFGSLDIALSCFFVCPDNFTVSLDANNSGTPGAAVESFSVTGAALGAFGANNPPLVLTSVLDPLLVAGTPYWITVSADLSDSIVWNWNSTGDTSREAISTDGGASWFAPSGLTPGAYEVVGIVPEPATVTLVGSVLGLLALRKGSALLRKRRLSRRAIV